MQASANAQHAGAGHDLPGLWQEIPTDQTLQATLESLRARGFRAELVPDSKAALDTVSSLLPEGAEVMTGGSKTLDQIGLTVLLKSRAHQWVNLKEKILAEKDPEKQMALRRQAVFADYFVGSVQAITEDGQLVAGSATGSQLAAFAYGGRHLVLVVGAQKITKDLNDALRRLREHSTPLEDQRMKSLGFPGTTLSKIFVYEKETRRSVDVVLVKQNLGF